MAKRKVTPQFRARFSEKLMDLGNLVVVALVIGQFATGKEFSLNLFSIGLVVALLCYAASYIISS